MNKHFFLLLALIAFTVGNSQILEPVRWKTSIEKISDTEYNLVSKATIESGWHLYSQNVPEDGPIPTTFTYDNSEGNFNTSGDTSEEEGHVVDDPIFQMKIKFFDKSAVFIQKVELIGDVKTVNGTVEFMVCDDSRCLPPTEVDLVYNITGGSNKENVITVKEKSVDNESVNNMLYGMVPENIELAASTVVAKKSLWTIFGLGFLGGLLALLTPCVFPMIPLTVSFFTKKGSQSKSSGIGKALLYGFFILLVYLILSIPFHLLDSVNPDILNEISTNVWLNVIFFIVFVFLLFHFLDIMN